MHPYLSEIEGSDIFYIPDVEGRILVIEDEESVRTFARLRQISEDVPFLIAAGFLAKPYPLEQLSQTVGRHVRRPASTRLSRSPG